MPNTIPNEGGGETIVIDQPPRGTDYNVNESQNLYEMYLARKPKLASQLAPKLYDVIDFSVDAQDGTKFFQTNKIRMKLNNLQRTFGYPAEMEQTVNFYNLIMFHLPFYRKLSIIYTNAYWRQGVYHRQGRSRRIVVDLAVEYVRWRLLFVFDIPNEYITFLCQQIPYFSIPALNLALENSNYSMPLFENLISYSGLNDKVIISNWDKIRAVLDRGEL